MLKLLHFSGENLGCEPVRQDDREKFRELFRPRPVRANCRKNASDRRTANPDKERDVRAVRRIDGGPQGVW